VPRSCRNVGPGAPIAGSLSLRSVAPPGRPGRHRSCLRHVRHDEPVGPGLRSQMSRPRPRSWRTLAPAEGKRNVWKRSRTGWKPPPRQPLLRAGGRRPDQPAADDDADEGLDAALEGIDAHAKRCGNFLAVSEKRWTASIGRRVDSAMTPQAAERPRRAIGSPDRDSGAQAPPPGVTPPPSPPCCPWRAEPPPPLAPAHWNQPHAACAPSTSREGDRGARACPSSVLASKPPQLRSPPTVRPSTRTR
jgi:hypothetical protein